MHEHLPTLLARLVDPLADRLELRLERVDPVVADALDVEHLDPPLAFLDPKRALSPGTLSGHEVRVRVRHGARAKGPGVGDVQMRRRDEGALADRDDVGDPERMQHERVRGVISDERRRDVQMQGLH